MSWPIASDYNDTIQFPRTCFGDADLKNATVKEDRLGLPRPICGMFASVYELSTPTAKWAVRCFLKPVEDQQRRYAAISSHLKNTPVKSAVHFEFIPPGIRVRSDWYPILKMEWIEGEPLNSYITKNIGQPHRLLQLAKDWVELMGSLRAAGIAHGDLQHGNVLVTPAGIRLIDYDGMYVPSLAGLKSNEEGHRNYQHPGRTGHDFGPYLDNFSAWVIFCSVMAVALDPRLWKVLNGGDECLLFRRDDFLRPDRSKAFQVLESSRPEVRVLAEQFKAMISASIRQVPALDGRVALQPVVTPNTVGPSKSVPDWVNDYVRSTRQTPVSSPTPTPVDEGPATVAAADWIIDHLVDQHGPAPTLRSHSFTIERSALVIALCATAVTGWAAAMANVSMISGLLIIFATVGGLAATLALRYWHVTGLHERRATSNSLNAARKVLAKYQADIKAIELARSLLLSPLSRLEADFRNLPEKIVKEVRGVETDIEKIRSAFAKKRYDLDADEAEALRKVEEDARRTLSFIQIERNSLDQNQHAAYASALKVSQDMYLARALMSATIDGASLLGIGPRLKANLRSSNIHTALDVEEWRVRGIQGIGDAKTSLLIAWKEHIIGYATGQPPALSQDQEFQIRARFIRRRDELDVQIRNVENEEQRQRHAVLNTYARTRAAIDRDERESIAPHERSISEIHERLQREKVRLDSEYRLVKAKLAPAKMKHEQELASANRTLVQQRFKMCKLEKEYDRFRDLSVGRYLKTTVGFQRTG